LAFYLLPSLAAHTVALAAVCHAILGYDTGAQLALLKGETVLQAALVAARPSAAAEVRDPVARLDAARPVRAPVPARPQAEAALVVAALPLEAESVREVAARPRLPVSDLCRKTQPQRPADPEAPPAAESTCEASPCASGVRSAASVQSLVKPTYPRLSRERGEEGTVVLAAVVRADGRVDQVRIVRSSGYARLDRAAMDALAQARFVPACADGNPVDSCREIPFTFRLVDAR
jgi:protein TonB